MILDTTLHDIDYLLDTAHIEAAAIFTAAARKALAPFNLSRHNLVVKLNPGAGLLVKDKNRKFTRCWWEVGRTPYKPGSALQVIAEIGAAIENDLPKEVAAKLNGITL